MKKLKIVFYTADNKPIQTIIAGHLDATRNITEISNAVSVDTGVIQDISLPEKIDHINIFEGLLTIYYQGGHFLEISRIYG